MLSVTGISQTTFWDKLVQLKHRIETEARSNRLLTTVRGREGEVRKPDNTVTREQVIKMIEDLVYNIILDLNSEKLPKFVFNKRGSRVNTTFTEGVGLQMLNDVQFHEISLENRMSLKRYTVTLACLTHVYVLLQTKQFSTKRDIYYNNVNLFKSQLTVDDAIANVCCMLNVPRYSLNVLSSSKGLVGGSLRFQDTNGNVFECGETGLTVPNHVEIICNVASDARYIIVIEKEATYTRLLEYKFHLKVGPCIMITGKGFPDINTRMLLKKLQESLQIPAFALVDADPHGIEIMCIYKYGSKSLSYEAANLTCPSLRWLGVLPDDIDFVGIANDVLIPMSEADEKKAKDLLKRPYIENNEELKGQILILLELKKKAEIECLDSVSQTFMTNIYLPQKIRNGNWI